MTKLEQLLTAAIRLLRNTYLPWESSGGHQECVHGRAKVVACKQCDAVLLAPYVNYFEDLPLPYEMVNQPKKASDSKPVDVCNTRSQYVPAPFGSRKP